MQAKELLGAMCDGKIIYSKDEGGTEFVMVVPRLERDLSPLLKITHTSKLRKRLTRFRDIATACYLLGEAIQYWFGMGIFTKGHLMLE